MKFLVGSQNFQLDTPTSDKDYVQVVFPDLVDLCRAISSTKEVKTPEGALIKYIDIRALPSLFYKSNLDVLQLLYAKEVENGGALATYFQLHEESLSAINLPRLYQSVMGSALSRYKRNTPKDLAHILFGFQTLVQFERNGFQNLRACFEHDQRELYQAVRHGTVDEWLPLAKEWEEKALALKEIYLQQQPNEHTKTQFEQHIGVLLLQELSPQ